MCRSEIRLNSNRLFQLLNSFFETRLIKKRNRQIFVRVRKLRFVSYRFLESRRRVLIFTQRQKPAPEFIERFGPGRFKSNRRFESVDCSLDVSFSVCVLIGSRRLLDPQFEVCLSVFGILGQL